MIEIYKDIPEYEGLYKISNFGKVKRLQYKKYNKLTKTNSIYKEHFLKPQINKDGYYLFILSKNGKTKIFTLHRLIASTFIPNPNNYPCINHKDGNKKNNDINNLEWCSFKYNVKHAYKNNLMTNCKRIQQYNLKNELIKEYFSINEASRQTNINQSNISMCSLGKRKTAGGYIWKYGGGNNA